MMQCYNSMIHISNYKIYSLFKNKFAFLILINLINCATLLTQATYFTYVCCCLNKNDYSIYKNFSRYIIFLACKVQ